jgi:eukaryotic translation initiation factor 2C
MPEAIADGKDRVQMFIKLHRELDLEGLEAYIDANHAGSDPDFNLHPIVDALNIAVTASLSDNIFQQSANKFFVKCGHQRLTGNANLKSLCTIRGYYYTIKPTMQDILLNVNAATSASFCPITLDEYFNNTTFTEDEATRLLKTLKSTLFQIASLRRTQIIKHILTISTSLRTESNHSLTSVHSLMMDI